MILGIITIILSGILYRFGGREQVSWIPFNQKIWRWLGIGLLIGCSYAKLLHSWIPLLSIPAYALAIQIGQYGEKSWLNFLGEKGKFFVCGVFYGLASFPILGFPLFILSGIVSGFGFLILKILDDREIVKNPWQEIGRGACGVLFYILK